MNVRTLDKLTAHYEQYFGQKLREDVPSVLHQDGMKPHIDVLIFEPDERYPFWKLATMGASDSPLPGKPKGALGNRNEYMMFIDAGENLRDHETLTWYADQLATVALDPIMTKYFLSYGHSMEWEPEGDSDMAGAYIEMPQMIEDTGVLRCKRGLLKTAVCLQVVLLTRPEIDLLMKKGPEWFSEYLYPEDENAKKHFLCERKRSDRF